MLCWEPRHWIERNSPSQHLNLSQVLQLVFEHANFLKKSPGYILISSK